LLLGTDLFSSHSARVPGYLPVRIGGVIADSGTCIKLFG
jgi:hypothetical protein